MNYISVTVISNYFSLAQYQPQSMYQMNRSAHQMIHQVIQEKSVLGLRPIPFQTTHTQEYFPFNYCSFNYKLAYFLDVSKEEIRSKYNREYTRWTE